MKQRLVSSDIPEAIPANILSIQLEDLSLAINRYKPGSFTLNDIASAIPVLRKTLKQLGLQQEYFPIKQKRTVSMPVFNLKEQRQLQKVLLENPNLQDDYMGSGKQPIITKRSIGIIKEVPDIESLDVTKPLNIKARRTFTDFGPVLRNSVFKKSLPTTPVSATTDEDEPVLLNLNLLLVQNFKPATHILVDEDNNDFESMLANSNNNNHIDHANNISNSLSSFTNSESELSSHVSADFSKYSGIASCTDDTNTSVLHSYLDSVYSFNVAADGVSDEDDDFNAMPSLPPIFTHENHLNISPRSQSVSPISGVQPLQLYDEAGLNEVRKPSIETYTEARIPNGSVSTSGINSSRVTSFGSSYNIATNLKHTTTYLSSSYEPDKVIQTYLEKSPYPSRMNSSDLLGDAPIKESVNTASLDDVASYVSESGSNLIIDNRRSHFFTKEDVDDDEVEDMPSATILAPAVEIHRSLSTHPNALDFAENPPKLKNEQTQSNDVDEPKISYLRPFQATDMLPVSGQFSITPLKYLDPIESEGLPKVVKKQSFNELPAPVETPAPLVLPKIRKITTLNLDPQTKKANRSSTYSLKDLTKIIKEDIGKRLFSYSLDTNSSYKSYSRYFSASIMPSKADPVKLDQKHTSNYYSSFYKLDSSVKENKNSNPRLVSLQDPQEYPSLRPPPTNSHFLSTVHEKETGQKNDRSNRFRRHVSSYA